MKMLEILPTYEEHQALIAENERLKEDLDIETHNRIEYQKSFERGYGVYLDTLKELAKYKEALKEADCMFQQIEDNVKKIPYYQEECDYFSRLDNIWKCISQALNQEKWRMSDETE